MFYTNDNRKETPIEDLEKEDKIALVLVLLKQLQPYLSASNLSVAPPRGIKSNGANPYTSSKKGQDMMSSSGAGDVEALNKILNNINV